MSSLRQRASLAGVLLTAVLVSAQVIAAQMTAGSDRGGASPAPVVQQLLAFRDADVKFSVQALMDILRDHRHEGWVLAVYADPVTHRPLIGAGFSLDLPEREHPQLDADNPHPFLEPSSAELWQAAGLDPERLNEILAQFNRQQAAVLSRASSSRHRRKSGRLRPVKPQISDEEASRLLRVAVIQAIDNAKAYCRRFDTLTASQQMALTQLVYQMGFNLVEFNQFLSLLNDDSNADLLVVNPVDFETEHWQAAQAALIESHWARQFRARAVSVIAMFDPHYLDDPGAAEMRVNAELAAEYPLPPAPVRRNRYRRATVLRTASYRKHPRQSARKQLALAN
jgi:hypothetical protein